MSKRGLLLGGVIAAIALLLGGFAIFIGLVSGAQEGSNSRAISGGEAIIVGGIVIALMVIVWTRGTDDSPRV